MVLATFWHSMGGLHYKDIYDNFDYWIFYSYLTALIYVHSYIPTFLVVVDKRSWEYLNFMLDNQLAYTF